MTQSSSDVDMDDPVVSEIPVYLNHLQDPPHMCGEIYVMLNTLRPNDRPYGDQGQMTHVELDDENNRLRINYALNSRAPTYDSSAAYPLRSHSLLASPVPKDASTPSYCIGILNEGVLNMVPVSAVCNVRPCHDHVDTDAASRRKSATGASESAPESSATKALTGKALHYQQLLRSLKSSTPSTWRRLDCYDYDSPEAADLFQEHILVKPAEFSSSMSDTSVSGERQRIRQMKLRELVFAPDETQEQYLLKLASGSWGPPDLAAASESHTYSETSGADSTNMGQISRLEFSRQIEAVLKRFQIAKTSEIIAALPPNTRARYSESEILAQIETCGICVQGNWVIVSHLSPHRPQVWDTRDAALLLLRAGREVTVQALSTFNNATREDSEEILKHLCRLDIQTNAWKLKLKPDEEFTASHPEIVKRQEIVSNGILARLRVKKEEQQQGAGATSQSSAASASQSGALQPAELSALCDRLRAQLSDFGSMKIRDIVHFIQSESAGHYITESTALEILRQIQAVMVRERWALPERRGNDAESNRLREILMRMYRERDALSKGDILGEFSRETGKSCDLSDHDLRRVIKEFAVNERGLWVFNGEPIAERRKAKSGGILKSEDLEL